MANSPLSTSEYLLEALKNTCNYNPDVSPSLVNYCERADVRDAAEYLHNIIQGDGEHLIEEYVRRRSLGKQSNKGEPMQIYKKPEVSLSTLKPTQIYKKPEVFSSKPVAGKNRKKLTPGTQSLKNASFVSKDNQCGVGGNSKNPRKEHTEGRVANMINPINLQQREKCDCQAREHKLVNNCLGCGKIICEREGEGPCMFCGRSEISHQDSPSNNLRSPAEGEAEDRANILKNKLLDQDRKGNLQTTIIDDQSDLYNIEENTWMSPEEKKKQQIILDEAESVRKNRTVFRLGADIGEVDFTTEDAIQQSDTDLYSVNKEADQIIGLKKNPNRQQSRDLHSANKEIAQTSCIKANPNIQECPVYVPTEKPAKQNGRMEYRRIPESMKVRSGRVQHDDPLFHVPSFQLSKSSDVFDICMPNNDAASQGEELIELSPSLYVQTKVKKQNTENCKAVQILRPGMVLLKKWLNENDQIEIVKICRRLGVGKGGFYQPVYDDGSKMHLWMMCLGKNWDPELRSYEDVRSYDNVKPPSLPSDFEPLVRKAIQSAHDELKNHSKLKEKDVQNVLPCMQPDVCIVNYYKESGSLGLHQDKDESWSSLHQGLPVVSFSIGDAAEFLYGTERDPEKAEKIILESGDVLIFGGESRHVFHGISVVKPDTCPTSLLRKTRLRRGRLNLTFRKI